MVRRRSACPRDRAQPRRRRGRLRCRPAHRPLPHGRRRQSAAPQSGGQDLRGSFEGPEAGRAAGPVADRRAGSTSTRTATSTLRRQLLRGRACGQGVPRRREGRRRVSRTPSIATMASRRPTSGSPEPAGHRSRRRGTTVKAKSGLSIALAPWPGSRRCSGGVSTAHRVSPCSTSTTTAISTWCSADRWRRPSPSSTIGSGSSTRRRSRECPAPTAPSRASWRPISTADGRADLVAAERWRAVCRPGATSPSEPPSRRRKPTLRIVADQCSATGDRRQAHRPRPRRPARPARSAGCVGEARTRSSCRRGLATKGSGSRPQPLPIEAREPGSRRPDGRRSGRRPAARHPGDQAGRGPALAAQPGQRPALAGPPAGRALAGQARVDAHQLARDRNSRHASKGRGSMSPTTTRRPTRAWASRSRRSCSGLGRHEQDGPGPPALARRRDAVRAQHRGRIRSSSWPRTIARPGAARCFSRGTGERFVCIGDFLGGGGLGYLVAPGVYSQPDRDEAMAITAEQLRPSDGVYRLSITEPMDEIAYLDHSEARRGRSAAGRLDHARRAVRPRGPAADRRADRLADGDRAGPRRPISTAAT